MAEAGLSVEVYEGAATPGGGCRTEELTLPGFRHDVCSAVHPLLVASPFFRRHSALVSGLRLRFPDVAFAHPLEGGRAAAVRGTVAETAASLGVDDRSYRRLFAPFEAHASELVDAVLAPPLRHLPRRPAVLARFGATGLLPAATVVRRFKGAEASALFAGVAAHSMLPLTAPLSGAFGILLGTLAHSAGWPVVEGGSAGLVDVMVGELERLGGNVVTDRWISSLEELPPARAVLLDVTPTQLRRLAGPALGRVARVQADRFRYGPGVCKVDWALGGPVPWQAEACRRSATVHVAGTAEEVVASEAAVAAGRHPERPYCIVVQPGVVDDTRAPDGQQTLWAYCHTPSGSRLDQTERIEAQIERFAPGFRDLVVERRTVTAAELEDHNPNYVGGDIGSGAATLRQTVFRPSIRWNPYRTGVAGVYLCGAATPPGAGVHGMCGHWAAVTALSDLGAKPG